MSRNYILKTKIFRPLQPPEAYTRQAIESAFPGGEWVEEPDSVPGGSMPVLPKRGGEAEEVAHPAASPNLTVIGDTKDLEALLALVEDLAPDSVIVGRLPSGRGAESKLAAVLEEAGVEVVHVEADPERFGKKGASDVNVEVVLTHDIQSPVLLVGNGTRVKQAKSWLERAAWPREVFSL